MGSWLALIAIIAVVVLLGTAGANAIMFKTLYPSYARSRAARGKPASRLRFLLTHGSILDPVDFLEARHRPGFGRSSILAGLIIVSMLVLLWTGAS